MPSADRSAVDVLDGDAGWRLLRVMDAIGSPLLVLDAEFKVVAANRAFYEQLDTRPDEVEQRAVGDLFAGAWQTSGLRDRLVETLSGQAPIGQIEVEAELPRLGRRSLIVRPGRLPSEETGGAPLILLGIEDITPLHQAERRAATQQAVIGVLAEAKNLDEAVPCLLAAFCRALGVDVAELWLPDDDGARLTLAGFHTSRVGLESFRDATTPMTFAPGVGLPGRVWQSRAPVWSTDVARDPTFVRADMAAAIGLRTGFAFPILADHTCEGVIKFVSSEKLPPDRPLLDMLVAIGRDIGQFLKRTRAEAALRRHEALRQSERRFREFMEHAELVCITLDRQGRIVFCNRFLLSLTGWRRDEIEGRIWFEMFIPADDRARINEVFAQSLTREEIVVPPNFENPILTKTGDRRLIAWNNVLVHDAAGEVVGITCVGSDVTEQRRAQEALEAAKAEAERANALKSQFLAATSHDLRQPLQTLGLLQGVLSRTVRDPGTRSVIHNLGDTVASMAGTIDALLDINQLESGAITPELIDFPAAAILNRVRSEYADLARTKGLELRVVACSAVIRSDPRLLGRLVDNLVANAIKYTAAGRVLIGCRRCCDRLRLEVWDTGVGIPEDQREAIFEAYHQLDNPARQRSRGLGLGLAVVQRMADLLGHRLEVRSTPGRGSMFAVEAALGECRRDVLPGKAPEGPAAAGHGISVLLVEDDPSVRESLALLLDLEGYAVTTATRADEALAMVARGSMRPRVLIADHNLPGGMSGVELVGRLKARFGQDVPAIVLTGDASDETRREIVAGGAAYLLKPVDAGNLLELIDRLVGGSRLRSRRPGRPRTSRGRRSSPWSTTMRRSGRRSARSWWHGAMRSRPSAPARRSWRAIAPSARPACWSMSACRAWAASSCRSG